MKRKYIWFLFLAFLISGLLTPVFTVGYATEMPPELDADAIRQDVVDWINNDATVERSRLITLDYVDLTKAYKFYECDNIFDIPETNFEAVKAILEAGEYVIQVPVYLDGNTWEVGVMRGRPLAKDLPDVLTEVDIAYLESIVGKWVVYSVGCYEAEIRDPYKATGEAAGILDKEPIIVGHIPNLKNTRVAIFPDVEGKLGKMVTLTPLYPDQSGLLSGTRATSSNGLVVMDYAYAKKALNHWPEGGGGVRGEIMVLLIVILVIFVIILWLIRRNSQTKRTGN